MASADYYQALKQDHSDSQESLLSDPDLEASRRQQILKRTILSLSILLTVSLLFNGIHIYQSFQLEKLLCPPTAFGERFSYPCRIPLLTWWRTLAGLVREVPIPFHYDHVYSNRNRTISDPVWNALVPETGVVALSHEYARSKGLFPAQNWPWDPSKGIYNINAFHNIHCLVSSDPDLVIWKGLMTGQQSLRNTVFEAFNNTPMTDTLEHALHCVNTLREEVICNADDTPKYTGRVNANLGVAEPMSGVGYSRMCNDWSKLEAFAIQNSACFKHINGSNPDFPTIERYKFCPDGRVLWPVWYFWRFCGKLLKLESWVVEVYVPKED